MIHGYYKPAFKNRMDFKITKTIIYVIWFHPLHYLKQKYFYRNNINKYYIKILLRFTKTNLNNQCNLLKLICVFFFNGQWKVHPLNSLAFLRSIFHYLVILIVCIIVLVHQEGTQGQLWWPPWVLLTLTMMKLSAHSGKNSLPTPTSHETFLDGLDFDKGTLVISVAVWIIVIVCAFTDMQTEPSRSSAMQSSTRTPTPNWCGSWRTRWRV